MADTPLFGFPYPTLADAPHGPQQLADLASSVEALLADLAGWKPFTVTWTAPTVNPVLNNGVIKARYAKLGKLVFYSGAMLMGSATTYGSGTWLFSLPTPARAESPQLLYPGGAYLYDNNVTANRQSATSLLYDTTHMYLQSPADASVQASQPFTWVNGDRLNWTLIYEAA